MSVIARTNGIQYYVIADMHLRDDDLGKWGRPDGYTSRIESSLKKLPSDSILIDLGDVAYSNYMTAGKLANTLKNCPAKLKILVIGNHDEKSYETYMNNGYDMVVRCFSLENLYFTHAPEPADRWPIGTEYNIHGHLHTNTEDYGCFDMPEKHPRHVLFSVEEWNYKAVHLNFFLTKKGVKAISAYDILPVMKGDYVVFERGNPTVYHKAVSNVDANSLVRRLESLTGKRHAYKRL